MPETDPGPALQDRAEFTLRHCGRLMRSRGHVSQMRGQPGCDATTTSSRYTCDGCAATLELHLTEPAELPFTE